MCALPFRCDRAMASDTIAKLCRPGDQIRYLGRARTRRFLLCLSFEYPPAFQGNLANQEKAGEPWEI